jgi:hypothetical protein
VISGAFFLQISDAGFMLKRKREIPHFVTNDNILQYAHYMILVSFSDISWKVVLNMRKVF